MEEWLTLELSNVLNFEVPEDLIQYVLSIQHETDLNEYMKTLLDFNNPEQKHFFSELVKRKFPKQGNAPKRQPKKNISNSKLLQVSTEVHIPVEDKVRKKTKYVNLYSQEGKNAQVVQLKGRHACQCQASRHVLINNCVRCGRIVCAQEGSGPCLYCGALVCTQEEQAAISAGSPLGERLMTRGRPKGWEDALLQRNRLLEYDRTSERRTRVTDDDCDYWSANSVWLSASEREKLARRASEMHDRKHASRLQTKMTFDFAGRRVVEEPRGEVEPHSDGGDVSAPAPTNAPQPAGGRGWTAGPGGHGCARDVAPGVNADLIQYDASVEAVAVADHGVGGGGGGGGRVQDGALQEMGDAGRCLSMHQPWAALLVDGIKLHEGRSWYTSHRGRLWIASTAKPADRDVIAAVENQYRALYPDKQLQFPVVYPAGCLLGCVTVTHCLPQEEYRQLYPEGESDSPFVLVCTDPISLRLRFPVIGRHKIYSLDKTIHAAALKCLQTMGKAEARAG